jgi:hypothetical protein
MTQRLVDEGQHAFQIAINFIVPETQYAEALADKMVVALRVTSGMAIQVMLAAIDLDDKALLETDEVYDNSQHAALGGGNGILVFSKHANEPTILPLAGSFVCGGCERFRSPWSLPHATSLRSATLPLRGRDCSCTNRSRQN